MDIRAKLNENRALAVAATLVLVAAIAAEAIYMLQPRAGYLAKPLKPEHPMFYTTDDGKTLFGGTDAMTAPFDHDGQQAVKAYVYTCDDGKTRFVQCLEKHADSPQRGLLVKKPGKGDWIPDTDPLAQALREPKCPNGHAPMAIVPVAP